jgi:radical SAM protein with 4Fe4S-binding SPASM domain
VKLDGYGKHAESVVFRDRPFLVTWQVRRAPIPCDPDTSSTNDNAGGDGELSAAEGRNLLERIAQHRTGIVVLCGSGSLFRADLVELIRHAKRLHLKVGLAPAPIRLLTRHRLRAVAEAGLDQIILPLEAPCSAAHDGPGHTPGGFAKTLARARDARELGLPVQIDTRFARWNFAQRDPIADLVGSLGATTWEVSFSLSYTRGESDDALRAKQVEQVFETVYRVDRQYPVWVKVREAPHYHRFLQQKEGVNPWLVRPPEDVDPVAACAGISRQICSVAQAADAGKSALFVDECGNVYPSAQLPIHLGNVRKDAIAAIYRQSPVLRELRDAALLKGKCGFCELRRVCGGSRARAFAASGDHLGPDPACAYIPATLSGGQHGGT